MPITNILILTSSYLTLYLSTTMLNRVSDLKQIGEGGNLKLLRLERGESGGGIRITIQLN